MTTTYTRGTKTARVKTARLTPGQRVLTEDATQWKRGEDGKFVTYVQDNGLLGMITEPVGPGCVQAAQTETGATIREVASLSYGYSGGHGFHQRAQREYTVHFTDGTQAIGNAPIYTWHAVA